MNEYIRQAEDARAAIVNRISSDPRAYRPNPVPKGIGLHSVAISISGLAVELRAVSTQAEKAITNWMCGCHDGGVPRYPAKVEKLILLCISIANFSMGLIILKTLDTPARPFVDEIESMGREAEKIASSLLTYHNDVFALHRYAKNLVNIRNKPLRQAGAGDHAIEVLTNVDAMRTIVLRYSSPLYADNTNP